MPSASQKPDDPPPGPQNRVRPAGTHLLIDVIGGKQLDSMETVENALRACVEACKVTLLHIHLHKFSPQGITGVAVLSESHITVHTWPEAGYGAFDVFMCGEAQPHNAIAVLRDAFEADDVRVKEVLRGAEALGRAQSA